MLLLASIVDSDALVRTVIASVVAGLGVTLAFSLGIYGAVRTAELRRDERPLAAGAAAGLMVLGLGVSLAAVTLGVIAMTAK
jgi:hypothetical protein